LQHERVGGEIESLAPGQPNLSATVDRALAFIGRRDSGLWPIATFAASWNLVAIGSLRS
jgi:hypothetical protein